MKKLHFITLCILFLTASIASPISALAIETRDLDYHDLFGQYKEMDGMAAEEYHIKVNEAFDADPEKFIAELSKEDADTIIHHAFYLAVEQDYKNGNTSVHEDNLNARLESIPTDSPLADTVTLLLNGNIMYEASKASIDPDQYKQNNYQKVQNAYQTDPELFLLSLAYFRYSSTIPHEIAGAIVYELSYDELTDFNVQLSADAKAVWADDDVQSVIELLKEKILHVMIVLGYEETDFPTLFSLADEVDGYLADAYFIEVSDAFDAAPEDFIAALAKQPFDKINTLSFYIALEHSQDFDSYSALLNSMLQIIDPNSAEYDALFLMRLSILRFDAGSNVNPDAFEQEHHELIQAYYNQNNRLFLLSLTDAGSRVYNDFADALVFELDTDELKSLDAQLAANTAANWATDEIQTVVDAFRNRIDAEQNPLPPITEPEPTETLPLETKPHEVPRGAADPSESAWAVALICVSLIIILCAAVLLLIRKYKHS